MPVQHIGVLSWTECALQELYIIVIINIKLVSKIVGYDILLDDNNNKNNIL